MNLDKEFQKLSKYRNNFEILSTKVNSTNLVYFDNAATSQKPNSVVDSITSYYKTYNSNVHRGIHYLSEKSTELYEDSRKKIANFINSKSNEVIFTRGTTHSLNMLASGLQHLFEEGDEIVISILEHHANFVVWQELCQKKKLKLNIIPLSKTTGSLDLNIAKKLINEKTKLVSVTACSNLLGLYTPINEILTFAKKYNCITILDCAQYIAHKTVNVRELDCDFLCFSSHKIFGPTGIGILYGKFEVLKTLKPFEYGGSMISSVSSESYSLGDIPSRFEAGTPNMSGAIGFCKAIEYVQNLDSNLIQRYEDYLLSYLLRSLKSLSFVNILFENTYKNPSAPIVSFFITGLDSYDIASFLNEAGIAVRSGHHCVMPLLQDLNVGSVTRVSLAFYNNIQEIDYLVQNLKKLEKFIS